MEDHKCPLCGSCMVSYGYDGLVCVKCGLVGQEPIISGRLAVV